MGTRGLLQGLYSPVFTRCWDAEVWDKFPLLLLNHRGNVPPETTRPHFVSWKWSGVFPSLSHPYPQKLSGVTKIWPPCLLHCLCGQEGSALQRTHGGPAWVEGKPPFLLRGQSGSWAGVEDPGHWAWRSLRSAEREETAQPRAASAWVSLAAQPGTLLHPGWLSLFTFQYKQ